MLLALSRKQPARMRDLGWMAEDIVSIRAIVYREPPGHWPAKRDSRLVYRETL
jgi:hypothetical protein